MINKNEKDDEFFEDMIMTVIEKTLLNEDEETYDKVSITLEKAGMTFGDCYKRPQVLNSILKELYGNTYPVFVAKIKNEIHDIQDRKNVAQFMNAFS